MLHTGSASLMITNRMLEPQGLSLYSGLKQHQKL